MVRILEVSQSGKDKKSWPAMSVCSLNCLLTGLISPIRLSPFSQQQFKRLSAEDLTPARPTHDSLDIVL